MLAAPSFWRNSYYKGREKKKNGFLFGQNEEKLYFCTKFGVIIVKLANMATVKFNFCLMMFCLIYTIGH